MEFTFEAERCSANESSPLASGKLWQFSPSVDDEALNKVDTETHEESLALNITLVPDKAQ